MRTIMNYTPSKEPKTFTARKLNIMKRDLTKAMSFIKSKQPKEAHNHVNYVLVELERKEMKKNVQNTLSEKLIDRYKKQKEHIINNSYDDHYGITLTRKDYEQDVQRLKNRLLRTTNKEKKNVLRGRIKSVKESIKHFEAQWSPYEDVMALIATIDEYLAEQELIERLWTKRREGKFVSWDDIKDTI